MHFIGVRRTSFGTWLQVNLKLVWHLATTWRAYQIRIPNFSYFICHLFGLVVPVCQVVNERGQSCSLFPTCFVLTTPARSMTLADRRLHLLERLNNICNLQTCQAHQSTGLQIVSLKFLQRMSQLTCSGEDLPGGWNAIIDSIRAPRPIPVWINTPDIFWKHKKIELHFLDKGLRRCTLAFFDPSVRTRSWNSWKFDFNDSLSIKNRLFD